MKKIIKLFFILFIITPTITQPFWLLNMFEIAFFNPQNTFQKKYNPFMILTAGCFKQTHNTESNVRFPTTPSITPQATNNNMLVPPISNNNASLNGNHTAQSTVPGAPINQKHHAAFVQRQEQKRITEQQRVEEETRQLILQEEGRKQLDEDVFYKFNIRRRTLEDKRPLDIIIEEQGEIKLANSSDPIITNYVEKITKFEDLEFQNKFFELNPNIKKPVKNT